MILLDVNVLIRAHRPDLPFAGKTLEWLEDALVDSEPVAVWDVVLSSAFRVLSNRNLAHRVDNAERAMTFLRQVRDASTVVYPGERHWDLVCKLVKASNATGNLVTDAAIAAVSLERGCRVATFDKDFARFPGVQWFEPVTA